jgi:hypothetical protein
LRNHGGQRGITVVIEWVRRLQIGDIDELHALFQGRFLNLRIGDVKRTDAGDISAQYGGCY